MEKIWHRFAGLFAAAGHEVSYFSRRWPGLANEEVVAGVRHCRLPGFSHRRQLPLNLLLDFFWGTRVLRHLPPADAVICNTVALPVFLRRLRPSAGHVCVSLGRMPKGQIRFYGGVSCLMAPSAAVAERVRWEHPALAERILLVPNPIDWPLHAQASRQSSETHGSGSRPLTIGYVGRIHPEKGLEQLLEACRLLTQRPSLPPWRLRLIGPVSIPQGGGGEAYRDGLVANCRASLGERLEFAPPVFDPVRLAERYGEMDVFCYPSLAAKGEGLSVAPLEAMASGAVPVVTRIAVYDDIVHDNQNGFRFDHTQNAADVTRELEAILARLLEGRDLRQRLARTAQESVRRFDYSAVADHVLAHVPKLGALEKSRSRHS